MKIKYLLLSCIVASCCTKAAASVEKDCIEKKPPEDGCMEPKHVVEEEQEI
jgi:hypothetical protein